MKYSIIIATYNRLSELKELIASVEQLSFDPKQFELIISDDGSSDGTAEYIENYNAKFNLRYIHQQNQGPGAARNHGMSKAHGDYFIFIDSDCIIPSDYLFQVDQYLAQHEVDAFGGPDDSHPDFPPLLKAINYAMTSFIGTGGTRGSTKSVAKFFPRSFNMGIHRKIFENIGGMNQLRHGQDMDLSARIYESGYSVALIPKAVVYHKRRTNFRRFYKQIFNWGVARINLGSKYPELLKPVHFLPAVLIFGGLAISIASIFSPIFKYLFIIGLSSALLIMLYGFVESFFRYRSLQISMLSIAALVTQITAYAFGTMSGTIQKLMGKKVAKGFSRNYYK